MSLETYVIVSNILMITIIFLINVRNHIKFKAILGMLDMLKEDTETNDENTKKVAQAVEMLYEGMIK